MIRRLDPLSLLLSLALILSPFAGHGIAAGGGPAYGLVICSENGAEVIAVDSGGDPVGVAHFCMECCLAATAVMAEYRAPAPVRLAPVLIRWSDSGQSEGPTIRLRPWGRAPPALV